MFPGLGVLYKLIQAAFFNGGLTGGRVSASLNLDSFTILPNLNRATFCRFCYQKDFFSILAGPDSVHVQSLRLSMEKLLPIQNITVVAVIGHSDCAGHPVSDIQHEEDSSTVSRYLKGLFPNVTFIPMVASPSEPGRPWNVKVVDNVVSLDETSHHHAPDETYPKIGVQEAAQMS